MKPTRRSFADHLFRWQPHARLDICGRGGAPRAVIRENRFGANVQARVLWVSKPSGPCDSAVGRLAVSLALDGGWAGWYCHFEGYISHQRALGRHWPPESARQRPRKGQCRRDFGRSARISRFGKRRVFRHSRQTVHLTLNQIAFYNSSLKRLPNRNEQQSMKDIP